MIRVSLVHDFDEARLFGVRYYASRLRRDLAGRVELEDLHPNPRGTNLNGVPRALWTLVVKEIVYPVQMRRRRQGADLAHVLDQSHAHLALHAGVPAVVTCHDIHSLESPNPVRRIGFRWRLRGLQRARAVVAVSEATRRDLVRALGIERSRIHVVRNRVDPFFLETPDVAEVDATRRRLGLTDAASFLHVGNTLPYKNLDRILEALGDAGRRLGRRPVFVKAGARLSDARRARAKALGVELREVGEVEITELRSLYHAVTALLSPSLHEGFGWPVAEALVSGLPVVASGRGALDEVTGGAALVVDPEDAGSIADAIERIAHDESLRLELSRRGRARRAVLADGDSGAEVLAVYREALG